MQGSRGRTRSAEGLYRATVANHTVLPGFSSPQQRTSRAPYRSDAPYRILPLTPPFPPPRPSGQESEAEGEGEAAGGRAPPVVAAEAARAEGGGRRRAQAQEKANGRHRLRERNPVPGAWPVVGRRRAPTVAPGEFNQPHRRSARPRNCRSTRPLVSTTPAQKMRRSRPRRRARRSTSR